MASKLVNVAIREAASGGRNEIDESNHVIKGVRILGPVSKNGRRYSEAAMMRAVGLYEGKPVNFDHPSKGEGAKARGFAESGGELRNVRYQKDGLHGDLHYWESHHLTPLLIERAKRAPSGFGLSHNAEGKATKKDGKLIVEEITNVLSVDVVTNPATVEGLFEEIDMPQQITLKEFAEQTKHPLLLKLAEDGEMAAMPMDAPPADASSDDQIKAAFRSAVMAAFDDESLDSKATLSKIKEVLKAYDKLKGGGEEKPAEEAPADDKATESIRAEVADLRKMLVESAIDTLTQTLGLREDKLDESQRSKLAACKTPQEAKSFIESLPAMYRGGSTGFKPGAANREAPTEGYKNYEEFLGSINRRKSG